MSENRARGKRNEAALAKRLGGKRVGIMGKEDIDAGPWSIEAKLRKTCVVEKWMQQAERNCHSGQDPMVIIHLPNQRRENDLVVIRLGVWEEWYGKL